MVSEPELSVTSTDATGTGVGAFTASCALPEIPPLVAVMVALPAANAVTSPDAETVASAVLSELHVMTRPSSTPPLASRVIAVACVIWPTVSDAELRETPTDDTGAGEGAAIVTAALPAWPSLVAVMVALPAVTAVTSPDAETVAASVLSDFHAMVRSARTTPPASRVTAAACVL